MVADRHHYLILPDVDNIAVVIFLVLMPVARDIMTDFWSLPVMA